MIADEISKLECSGCSFEATRLIKRFPILSHILVVAAPLKTLVLVAAFLLVPDTTSLKRCANSGARAFFVACNLGLLAVFDALFTAQSPGRTSVGPEA